jgi:hypothetical protein
VLRWQWVYVGFISFIERGCVFVVLDSLWLRVSPCNDQTSLGEQAPNLIDHGSPLAHQNGTHPMDGLDIFLLDRLNADKSASSADLRPQRLPQHRCGRSCSSSRTATHIAD